MSYELNQEEYGGIIISFVCILYYTPTFNSYSTIVNYN